LDVRVPPFMLSKKHVLTVLGFYVAKKINHRDGQQEQGKALAQP